MTGYRSVAVVVGAVANATVTCKEMRRENKNLNHGIILKRDSDVNVKLKLFSVLFGTSKTSAYSCGFIDVW